MRSSPSHRTRRWARLLPLAVALFVIPLTFWRSAAAAPTTASLVVYDDALASGWSNWSWDATVNPSAASPVYAGSRSLSATTTKAWGGLYLHSKIEVATTPATVLQFAAQASGRGGRFGVVLFSASDRRVGGEVLLANAGGEPAPGAWTLYSIPLSAFSSQMVAVGGFAIQDESGVAQPALFVDAVSFGNLGAPLSPLITPTPRPSVTPQPSTASAAKPTAAPSATPLPTKSPLPTITPQPSATPIAAGRYPWHTNITAVVFWIGEPVGGGSSETQVVSAYDDDWMTHYGGAEGGSSATTAEFPPRRSAPNYFPRRFSNGVFGAEFTPMENPFFVDVPFDDVNNAQARALRASVIPWAGDAGYATMLAGQSMLKNRWVQITRNGVSAYAQVEDAGPYVYADAAYVFGSNDARPASTRAHNAGMDVSPAVRDLLGFTNLNDDSSRINWRFVEAGDVPDGPWKRVITTSVTNQH